MPDHCIRVLCVEDHAIVREGIAVLIGTQRDIEVVGAAASGEEAIALFQLTRPDITLMDLQLPGMSGIDAIEAIRRHSADARFIVLTMYHGDEDIHRALKAGAAAYLLKDTLTKDLLRVIREVHDGNRSLGLDVQERLTERASQRTLTARELQVIELIAQGMRNKEIAASLDISEDTAHVHVRSILGKLNVHDRTAAISVALRRGIIHLR